MTSRGITSRVGTRILVGLGAIAALTMIATTGDASAAEPPAETDDALAACTRVQSIPHRGRTVTLWRCGDKYHGQITGALEGDSVWLAHGGGDGRVPPGGSSANSGTWPVELNPINNACGTVWWFGRYETACTCMQC